MNIEQLTKLCELKEKGILSQEEFEVRKKQLLESDKKETKKNSDKPIKHIPVFLKKLIIFSCALCFVIFAVFHFGLPCIEKYKEKKLQEAISEIQNLIPNILMYGAGTDNYEFLNSEKERLSVVPEKLLSGNKLINRYGGEVYLIGKGKDFQIIYEEIPETVCQKMLNENWGNEIFVSGCNDCKKTKCSISWSTSNNLIDNSSISEQNISTPNRLYHQEWSNQEICLRNYGGAECLADVEYRDNYANLIKHGGCYINVMEVGPVMQDWNTCQNAAQNIVLKITPEGEIITLDQETKDFYFEKLGEVMSDEEYQSELKEIYENYPEYRKFFK